MAQKFKLEDAESLLKESADVLSLFLRGDITDESQHTGVKIAVTTYSATSRIIQSSVAKDGMAFVMARDLSENKKELQELINKALPNSVFAKKLK